MSIVDDSTFGLLNPLPVSDTIGGQSASLGAQTVAAASAMTNQKFVAIPRSVRDRIISNRKRKQGDENVNIITSKDDANCVFQSKKIQSRVFASSQAADNDFYFEGCESHCRATRGAYNSTQTRDTSNAIGNCSVSWDDLEMRGRNDNNNNKKRADESRVLRSRDQCRAPQRNHCDKVISSKPREKGHQQMPLHFSLNAGHSAAKEEHPIYSRADRLISSSRKQTSNPNNGHEYKAKSQESPISNRKMSSSFTTNVDSGSIRSTDKRDSSSTVNRGDPKYLGSDGKRSQHVTGQSYVVNKASTRDRREKSPYANSDRDVERSFTDHCSRNYSKRKQNHDDRNRPRNFKDVEENRRMMPRHSANLNKCSNEDEHNFRKIDIDGRKRVNESRNMDRRTGDHDGASLWKPKDRIINSKPTTASSATDPNVKQNGSNERVPTCLAKKEKGNPIDDKASVKQKSDCSDNNCQFSLTNIRDYSHVSKARKHQIEGSAKQIVSKEENGFEDFQSHHHSLSRTSTPIAYTRSANDGREAQYRSVSSRTRISQSKQQESQQPNKCHKRTAEDLPNGASAVSQKTEQNEANRSHGNCDKSLFDIDVLSRLRRSTNSDSNIVDLPVARVVSVKCGDVNSIGSNKATSGQRSAPGTTSSTTTQDSWLQLNNLAAQRGLNIETQTRAGFTGRNVDVFLFEFYVHINNYVFSGSGSTLADARANCASRAIEFLEDFHKREVVPFEQLLTVQMKQKRRGYHLYPVSNFTSDSRQTFDSTDLTRDDKVVAALRKSLFSVLLRIEQHKCNCNSDMQNAIQLILRAIHRLALGFPYLL